jgi:TonB family protein
MAATETIRAWTGPSRRRVPRFSMQAPLDVTVLRCGIPDKLPGRSLNIGERGLSAMLAGEVIPGEAVGVEVWLPAISQSLRTRALVRYQDKLRCGIEFVGLSADQKAALRDCAKEAKVETEAETGLPPVTVTAKKEPESEAPRLRDLRTPAPPEPPERPRTKESHAVAWILLLFVAICVGMFFWWRWNKQWEALEAPLKNRASAAAEKPQAQVSAEVMQKLLIHRVEPVYPPEARQARLEGTIALDIVVGRDGSVISMHPLNGPDMLARAAMDALRWWKFEPYRMNGEPTTVETTVAVEFKR